MVIKLQIDTFGLQFFVSTPFGSITEGWTQVGRVGCLHKKVVGVKISIQQYVAILMRYIRNQRLRFTWLTILLFAGIALQIVNPQITRMFIDAVATGAAATTLMRLGLAYLGIALIGQIVSVGATYMGESVAWQATNALREDLAAHSLTLDMSYHTAKSPGEYIERIETDAGDFANFFSQLVIRVIGNLLLLLGVLPALVLIDARLGLAFILFAAATLVALNKMRAIAIPHQKANKDAETELFGFLEERLSGTEDIRSCGAVDYVLGRLYEHHAVILSKRWMAELMRFCIGAVSGLMMVLGYTMAMLLGYRLYQAGIITVGVAYLVISYMSLVARPIRELTQQIESFQTIGATVERMSELLEQESQIQDGPGFTFSSGALNLTFTGVGFSYAPDKPVLHDITFHLAAGKVLGLLGRTGGGKTTIARLVFRLCDPQTGVIRLDGKDIRQATLAQLRERIAYVTQEVQLFQATVRENITLFDARISDERILAVIESLGLQTWYERLPAGLDTKLQSGGRSLSAGEAQLLALCRAFLRNPGMVVLDEASSRLDPATEALVEQAIDRLLSGRTAIIIAHRLATLQRADHILIIDSGQIAEYGDRQQLLADPSSRYFQLHQTGLEEKPA
ncbi:MAG TPA: ABC transporter ATP-binding protein [Firmicutes bacterium]|nr:ABC transporter ATP-binding protein [Bacillota bacterium]